MKRFVISAALVFSAFFTLAAQGGEQEMMLDALKKGREGRAYFQKVTYSDLVTANGSQDLNVLKDYISSTYQTNKKPLDAPTAFGALVGGFSNRDKKVREAVWRVCRDRLQAGEIWLKHKETIRIIIRYTQKKIGAEKDRVQKQDHKRFVQYLKETI